MIQVPQQIVLPIGPHSRPNGLSIGVGQQQEHVQDIQPVHNLHELFNGVWIVQVPPLRHMTHQEMMPHQRLNLL